MGILTYPYSYSDPTAYTTLTAWQTNSPFDDNSSNSVLTAPSATYYAQCSAGVPSNLVFDTVATRNAATFTITETNPNLDTNPVFSTDMGNEDSAAEKTAISFAIMALAALLVMM